MPNRRRLMIDLSLAILRDASARSSEEKVDTPEVRLALYCLWPFVRERSWLASFWTAASGEHDIGRSQSLAAGYNGICRQLRLTGNYPD
jgi:hypothetical protein